MWLWSFALPCVSFLALQVVGTEERKKTGLIRSMSQARAYDSLTKGAMGLDKGGDKKRVADEEDGDDDDSREAMGLDAEMSTLPAVPTIIRNRSLQSLFSAPPSPAPTMPLSPAPTMPPSPAPTSVEDVTMVPLCKVRVDENGNEGVIRQYVRPNSQRYFSTRSKTIESKINVTAAKSHLKYADVTIAGIQAVGAAQEFRTKLTGALQVTEKFAKGVAAFGAVSIVAISVLGALGVLGESQETKNFNVLVERLDQIKTQLNAIQNQIREGFLDLKKFVADVVLDELAADLDAIGRAYNDYMEAPMELRLSKYEPKLRDVCNTAFRTPEDIFYNLYGYVCDKCTYAPKKRADFYSVAKEQSQNSKSQREFIETFGNFFMQSMLQAIALQNVCPDAIEGTCTDRTEDIVWEYKAKNITDAMSEALGKMRQTHIELGNFVPILKKEDLEPHIVSPNDTWEDMKKSAKQVLDYFTGKYQDFYFQVTVFARKQSKFVAADGCEMESGTCELDLKSTGHIYFRDEIKGAAVHIRYRSIDLPDARQNLPDGRSFVDFYQNEAATKYTEAYENFLSSEKNIRLVTRSGIIFPLDSKTSCFTTALQDFPAACQVPTICQGTQMCACDEIVQANKADGSYSCSGNRPCESAVNLCPEDQVQPFRGKFLLFRNDPLNGYPEFGEATSNATAFPQFVLKFGAAGQHRFVFNYGV